MPKRKFKDVTPRTRGGGAWPANLVACLVLALLAAAIYAQTKGFGFLHFDDPDYVTANPMVRGGLTWGGIKAAFSLNAPSTYWHPLTWLSLMLDVELFGVTAGPMHLINAGLHVLAVVLLFLFLRTATGRLPESLLAAAVFAAHPMAVEAVAWVTERKTVLSGALAMGALLAYAWYARRPGPKRYAVVAALLALGLMAKPTLVALPLGLAALDVWPLERAGRLGLRGQLREKLPLLALGLAVVVLAVVSRPDTTLHAGEAAGVPLSLRLANIPVICLRYLAHFVWPHDLSVYYAFPASVPVWQWAGALALLAALLGGAWAVRRRAAYVPSGLVWFLVMLAPVSGVVQVGLWPAMADRFAYLPMVGLSFLTAFGLFSLPAGRGSLAGLLGLALVLGHFAFPAWMLTGLWGSGSALFAHASALAPNDPVARHHLGVALVHEGRIQEGLEALGRARAQGPGYLRPVVMTGDAQLRLMEFREAERTFRAALAMDPSSRDARVGLAEALAGQDEREAAMDAFRSVLDADPGDLQARLGLGRVLLEAGGPGRALEVLRGSGGPAPAMMHALAGRALLALDRPDEARRSLERALEVEPTLTEALSSMAEVLDIQGRASEADAYRRRARHVTREEARAFAGLGLAALDAGRTRDAAGYFRRALKLDPDLETDPELAEARDALRRARGD